jgi:hypothetical protein
MHVNYQHRPGGTVPVYRCDRDLHNYQGKICQSIQGHGIDRKVSELLVGLLTPEAVEHAAAVQRELDGRRDETLTFFKLAVDRGEYEAGLVRKRYMGVDPDNRLVALHLESAWNKALSNLDEARDEYARQVAALEKARNERDYEILEGLPQSFSEAFLSDSTDFRDKKRMVRYLLEDVTLLKADGKILIQIRFKGGATEAVEIDAPMNSFKKLATDPAVISYIDAAAEDHCSEEIAEMLNREGFKPGRGKEFSKQTVRGLMKLHSIASKKQRYISRGYITSTEKADLLGVSRSHLHQQLKSGRFDGDYVRVNTKNEVLFPRIVRTNVTHP